MELFVWGFCGPVYNIVEQLQTKHGMKTFSVSDAPSSNLNIHDLFFRKVKTPQPDLALRKKLLPYFDTFKELYSRHWYPKTVFNKDYLSHFNLYVDFFSELYHQRLFTGVIFSNIPHEGPDYIAFLVAKEMGVRSLMFYQTIFTNRIFVSEEINLYDSNLVPQDRGSQPDLSEHFELVDNAIKEIGNWFYMNRPPRSNHFTPIQVLKNSRKCLKKNPYLIIKLLLRDLQYLKDYRETVTVDFSTENLDFVYFPLHLQPELTTSILGNGFTDQLKAIKHLSENLPKDVKIVVKENPKQNSFKRPPGYLKELTKIPNVILAPVNYPTINLVKKCKAVTTINGTVGWEAINLGKPVLYYGICWYRDLPNVYNYTELNKFAEIVNKQFNKEEIRDLAGHFLYNNTLEGTVDADYCKTNSHFDYQKNASKLAHYIAEQITPQQIPNPPALSM